MIILIAGEKGGTGKTTLSTNLAAMRAADGYDTLLIDTDPQGSSNFWSGTRVEAEIEPRISCVLKFGKGLPQEVRALSEKYQDIIIDAGGRDSVEMRSAMVACDRLFIPIQPSQFDVWTLTRMDELVDTASGFNPDMDAKVVISRASTNPSIQEAQETAELLADFEHLALAESVIRDRIAYRKAAKDGLSVCELKPKDQKAVAEMTALYEEIFNA